MIPKLSISFSRSSLKNVFHECTARFHDVFLFYEAKPKSIPNSGVVREKAVGWNVLFLSSVLHACIYLPQKLQPGKLEFRRAQKQVPEASHVEKNLLLFKLKHIETYKLAFSCTDTFAIQCFYKFF